MTMERIPIGDRLLPVMKSSAIVVVIIALGLLYGLVVYQTKDASPPPSGDRNVPGATTGPGRNSLASPDPLVPAR
jgi:hypothetical protein